MEPSASVVMATTVATPVNVNMVFSCADEALAGPWMGRATGVPALYRAASLVSRV